MFRCRGCTRISYYVNVEPTGKYINFYIYQKHMPMRCIIWGVFLVFFCFQKAFAQQPIMKQYTVNDGLPSSEVYFVMQDSKGYIWLTTDRGVARFDGYTFTTYTTENGLCDNTVFDIYEDPKKRLWFRTYSGKLCCYDQGKFVSIPDSIAPARNLGTHSIYVDQQDTLWVAPKNDLHYDLFKYSPGYMRRKTFVRDTVSPCDAIFIKEIKEGFVASFLARTCMPNERYIVRLIAASGKVSRYELPEKQAYYLQYNQERYKIIRRHTGSYLFTGGKDVLEIDQRKGMQVAHLDKELVALYEDRQGRLWTGYLGGGVDAYVVDALFGKFVQKPGLHPEYRFLAGKSVTAVLQDREGGYWFTTLEEGVYYLPSLAMESYTTADGLPDNKVLFVAAKKPQTAEGMYIGMQDGWISQLDKGRIRTLSHPALVAKGNTLLRIAPLSQGDVWVSSTGKELYSLKSRGFVSERNRNTKALLQTDAHTVWATQTNMLARYTLGQMHQPVEKKTYRYPDLIGYALCQQGNRIWIGSIKGLFSIENEVIQPHRQEHPWLGSRISDIGQSSDGCLWMSTRGEGIIIKNKNKLYRLNTKHGLANNLCNNLFITVGDTVWVASNSGLSRIVKDASKGTYQIRTLTTNDGLASNEINQVCQVGDKVWVATNKGLSVFHPQQLNEHPIPPPIYITGVRVNEKDTVLLKKYYLEHDQNSITISFVGLSYKDAGKIRYKYRMEGLDTVWVRTKATNVRFAKLPPGRYTFRVVALSNGRYVSTAAAYFEMHIATPYWKTGWFRLAIVLLLVAVIAVVLSYRLRQVFIRNKLELELNQSKQQALAAQMEPHFVFNSLSSIQNYILQENKEAANTYLTKLAKLIRMTLDHTMQHYISLEEELGALKLYLELEKMRFKNKFEFTITIDPELQHERLKVPALIIQPYAENAILHGIMPLEGIGKLEIELEKQGQSLLYRIRDNGIGRKKSQMKKNSIWQYKSVGMSITQKRVELINAVFKRDIRIHVLDLENQEGQSTGTQVEVLLPLIR